MKIQLSWTLIYQYSTADKKVPPVSAGGFLLGFIQEERTVPDLRVLGVKDSAIYRMESDQGRSLGRDLPVGRQPVIG